MRKVERLSSEKRREQIIDKATALFSTYGFEKATIAHLASACKITEPALYRYFPSKKKIYSAVLKSIYSRVDTTGIDRAVAGLNDIEKILYTVADGMFNVYLEYPEIARLLLHCSLSKHHLTKEVYDIIRTPFINILAGALTRLKRKGKIIPIDPEITAGCFIGMVSECAIGANLWKKADKKATQPRKRMKNSIPIFARGLKK